MNLRLERTEPTQVGNSHDYVVIITATLRDKGRPVADKKVKFSLNGKVVEDGIDQANEMGIARVELTLRPGSYIVEALIDGDTESRTIRFAVRSKEESEEHKKPSRLSVALVGSVLAAIVLSRKGPVRKRLVRVMHAAGFTDLSTDRNGAITYQIEDGDQTETYVVLVLGTSLKEEIRKPKKQEEKKRVPVQPKKLVVQEVTKGSYSWVTITVLDAFENGTGIEGVVVRLHDVTNTPPCIDLPPTNKFGITRFEYNFNGRKDVSLRIFILGTEINTTLVLRCELRRL